MKRTTLKIKGDNNTATLKQEIQALVRLICAYRDGGCVLRGLRHCGGEAVVEDGKIISNNVIQADHLITRANSATFADTRLIVCICKNCHGWKKWNEKSYEKLVRVTLPNDRKNLWDICEEQRHAHKTKKMDWRLELINLKRELKQYDHL